MSHVDIERGIISGLVEQITWLISVCKWTENVRTNQNQKLR